IPRTPHTPFRIDKAFDAILYHVTTHIETTQWEGRTVIQLQVAPFVLLGRDQQKRSLRTFKTYRAACISRPCLDNLLLIIQQLNRDTANRQSRHQVSRKHIKYPVITPLDNE